MYVSFYYFEASDFEHITATQYCDGLRGAMVVYDPNDPHLSLYGQFIFSLSI
jgi:hypothetical protein